MPRCLSGSSTGATRTKHLDPGNFFFFPEFYCNQLMLLASFCLVGYRVKMSTWPPVFFFFFFRLDESRPFSCLDWTASDWTAFNRWLSLDSRLLGSCSSFSRNRGIRAWWKRWSQLDTAQLEHPTLSGNRRESKSQWNVMLLPEETYSRRQSCVAKSSSVALALNESWHICWGCATVVGVGIVSVFGCCSVINQTATTFTLAQDKRGGEKEKLASPSCHQPITRRCCCRARPITPTRSLCRRRLGEWRGGASSSSFYDCDAAATVLMASCLITLFDSADSRRIDSIPAAATLSHYVSYL